MPIPEKSQASANLVLASSSERRQQLLRQIGVDVICVPADIDETPLLGESVEALVSRLAAGKAQAIATSGEYRLPILGADTIVSLDGEALGKPQNKEQAVQMLLSLQGREHHVITGVCLLSGELPETREREESIVLVTSTVRFAPITPDEAESYWLSGEPMGKAGAYAIQGIAARFVAHLSGSYSNVVGLPLFETARLLDNLEMTRFAMNTEHPQLGNT